MPTADSSARVPIPAATNIPAEPMNRRWVRSIGPYYSVKLQLAGISRSFEQ
ncbi:MAG: hypothetical protein ACYDER_25630 [Ktedonobacteraceae bacterium]